MPFCLDTLAWAQHRLGRDVEAVRTIPQARAASGRGTEMRWHGAVIYAAMNDPSRAAPELSAALTADQSLANRDDVQKLSRQLGAGRNAAAR